MIKNHPNWCRILWTVWYDATLLLSLASWCFVLHQTASLEAIETMWPVLGASGQLYLTCTALVISSSLPSNCKWLSIWMPTWCSLTKFHGNVMSRHEFLGHAACLWGTWAVAEDGQECHRRLTRCRRQADECMHCNQQPLAIDIQWFTAFLGNDPLERCNMFVVHAKLKRSSSHLLVPILVKSIFCQSLVNNWGAKRQLAAHTTFFRTWFDQPKAASMQVLL